MRLFVSLYIFGQSTTLNPEKWYSAFSIVTFPYGNGTGNK